MHLISPLALSAANHTHVDTLDWIGLLQKAKSQNAAMLFLPECCSFIGRQQEEERCLLITNLLKADYSFSLLLYIPILKSPRIGCPSRCLKFAHQLRKNRYPLSVITAFRLITKAAGSGTPGCAVLIQNSALLSLLLSSLLGKNPEMGVDSHRKHLARTFFCVISMSQWCCRKVYNFG